MPFVQSVSSTRQARTMSNVAARILTGLFFIGILLFSVIWDPVSLIVVLSIILFLSGLEFRKLFKDYIQKGDFWIISLMLGYFPVVLFHLDEQIIWLALILIAPFFIMIYHLFIPNQKNFNSISVSVMGWVYLTVPISLLLLFSTYSNYQSIYVWGLLVLVWTYDTAAYTFGKLLGKHKMNVQWSSNKSWEGFAGGLIFTSLAGVLIHFYTGSQSYVFWIFSSLIVIIFGTMGDFFESMLKRQLSVKDSGDWLPGHGGILDRFDTIFFVTPFYFCLHSLFIYFTQ